MPLRGSCHVRDDLNKNIVGERVEHDMGQAAMSPRHIWAHLGETRVRGLPGGRTQGSPRLAGEEWPPHAHPPEREGQMSNGGAPTSAPPEGDLEAKSTDSTTVLDYQQDCG